MKTTTAEKHGYKCPKCKCELARDKAGRGFVRHKSKRDGKICGLEIGLRDR
jgi:hypothetical protein